MSPERCSEVRATAEKIVTEVAEPWIIIPRLTVSELSMVRIVTSQYVCGHWIMRSDSDEVISELELRLLLAGISENEAVITSYLDDHPGTDDKLLVTDMRVLDDE